ncbi:hypothetical protein MUP77_13745 [Candidatus Bathyarchaeota archaeon]|nr:hypothetical protein [Candidatus Bathyarchaeota archaeon]
MSYFKIDIEESRALADKGILCLVNKAGRKFYVRPKETGNKDYPMEMIPLSTEEMRQLGLTVEESENDTIENQVDIEESASEPEKKPRTFDPRSEADMKEAAKLAEQALAKLKKDDPEKWASPTEEQLKEENEDLKGKLSMIAEVALEKKKKELGCTDSEINTPEALMAWEKGKTGRGSTPSGSAPLQSNYEGFMPQNTGDIIKRKFNSVEEMIMALRKQKTPESEAIIKELWRRGIQGWREAGRPTLKYPPDDPISPNQQTEKIIDTEIPEQDSELERWGIKKKTHRTQMKKVDKEGNVREQA